MLPASSLPPKTAPYALIRRASPPVLHRSELTASVYNDIYPPRSAAPSHAQQSRTWGLRFWSATTRCSPRCASGVASRTASRTPPTTAPAPSTTWAKPQVRAQPTIACPQRARALASPRYTTNTRNFRSQIARGFTFRLNADSFPLLFVLSACRDGCGADAAHHVRGPRALGDTVPRDVTEEAPRISS